MAFWDALKEANDSLSPLGLYLSHIFEEKNIFLRPGWSSKRVGLSRPVTKHLILYRPATLDLILTKMMRGSDPQHMQEIQWMIDTDQITLAEMTACMDEAVIPDDDAIWQELFQEAKAAVLAMQYVG